MKMVLAIIICKLLYLTERLIGKGSSLPGVIALKLCPDILRRIKLPEKIIAVTGSNGKTTTAQMLARALEADGKSVALNIEGSNQIGGITTLLLRHSRLQGSMKCDVIVMECDERHAKSIFEIIRPDIVLITNLCRDQLTRNGHPEFVLDALKAAIKAAGDNALLVLNADEPYCVSLATMKVIYYGIASTAVRQASGAGVYDDGAFCPRCKAPMRYDYRLVSHFGSFECSECGYKRAIPDVELTALDYNSGAVRISVGESTTQNKSTIQNKTKTLNNTKEAHSEICARLIMPGLTGAYNITAAIAGAVAASGHAQTAAQGLDLYKPKGGRTVDLNINGRRGTLLVSKHENSLSYNQSMEYIIGLGIDCTVIIMVDSISRKYYTSDTSWLWDIDFDILARDTVKNIVLTGQYGSDLAARFAMSSIDMAKVACVDDYTNIRELLSSETSGEIFALTCFSDKAKLLKALRRRK